MTIPLVDTCKNCGEEIEKVDKAWLHPAPLFGKPTRFCDVAPVRPVATPTEAQS